MQDFMTYADVTDRYKEIREILELVCGIPQGVAVEGKPEFVVDPVLKTEVVSSLLKKLVDVPDAPTRDSISKEMVEMNRVKEQTQLTLAGVDALGREMRAIMEAFNLLKSETTTDGPIVSQPAEA